MDSLVITLEYCSLIFRLYSLYSVREYQSSFLCLFLSASASTLDMKVIDSRESLFVWTLSQFAILQIVKTGKKLLLSQNGPLVIWTVWPVLLVSDLYILLINCNNRLMERIFLTSFATLMIVDGSLSNHVVTASSLAVLALAVPRTHLVCSTTWLCGLLYFVTGIHKLNSDFFNPKHSCASLYMAGSLSVLPLEFLEYFRNIFSSLVAASPYCAVIFELIWPFLLILSTGTLYQFAFIVGSCFHAVLALPPSPLYVINLLLHLVCVGQCILSVPS